MRATTRSRAIADYYRFSVFNVISFSFLAGNIIVLYALRFGANSVLVGLISASYQLTFLFTLVGRRIIRRVGAVRLFGYSWLVRYVLMLPVLLTALPSIRDRPPLVLTIVTLCAYCFNVSKGIGITGSKPLVGEIPARSERGAFLSNQHLIVNLGAIVTGSVMAFVLGDEGTIARYMILLAVGIIAGLFASYFILRLPEPREAEAGFAGSFRAGVGRAFATRAFRKLNAVNLALIFGGAMVSAFLIVFFKSYYGHADGTVVFFTVAGSAGGAVMAVTSRALIDRVGAKPLLFIYAGLTAVTVVPVALALPLAGAWLFAFPVIIYFLFVMGQFGVVNALDNYFFSITAAEERLDRGIVFGIGSGIAGALGSFLGGVLLSFLEGLFATGSHWPFSIYFAVAAAVILAALVLTTGLSDVESIPIQDALGILVSPRDIRAIRLLNRLRRSRSVGEERAAVAALAESSSRLPVGELAERIASPSLEIRIQAINALRNLPLTPEVEEVLMREVKRHHYTTAYLAAELLGEGRVSRAVTVLREAIDSPDYMLCAKAMVALAQINDRASIGRIERHLDHSPNPRVTIYAVKALEIMQSASSLPAIFRRIERRAASFVRDELILCSAGIVGILGWFYPLYIEFLKERLEAIRTVGDLAEALPARECAAIRTLFSDPQQFGATAISFFERTAVVAGGTPISPFFVDALRNRNVGSLERFRFFVACVMISTTERAPGGT